MTNWPRAAGDPGGVGVPVDHREPRQTTTKPEKQSAALNRKTGTTRSHPGNVHGHLS